MTTASLRGRSAGFSTSSSRISLPGRVRRVWDYRRILRLLVARDLKVRYAGSALGYLWTVLDPLAMSAVYWFVFTKIFHRNVGFEPYILFLLSGQILWMWFQGGIPGAARALRGEAQMVRSSNVPRELWVVRTVTSKMVEYLLSLPVVAIFAVLYGRAPGWGICYLPLAVLYCYLLVLAGGLILAPLTVLVRDVDRIIPIVMRFLFYCSPVLYSVHNIPAGLQHVYNFNPTVGMLVLARATFFHQELVWEPVIISGVLIVVLLAVGVTVFTRMERQVLKEI